jgi:hypothetical protein
MVVNSHQATGDNRIMSVIRYHLVGPERVGKELFVVRKVGNQVEFKMAVNGPIYWTNSGEFRDAVGSEKALKKLVRHKDKMFLKGLWQGGRARANELGLRKWYVS